MIIQILSLSNQIWSSILYSLKTSDNKKILEICIDLKRVIMISISTTVKILQYILQCLVREEIKKIAFLFSLRENRSSTFFLHVHVGNP